MDIYIQGIGTGGHGASTGSDDKFLSLSVQYNQATVINIKIDIL